MLDEVRRFEIIRRRGFSQLAAKRDHVRVELHRGHFPEAAVLKVGLTIVVNEDGRVDRVSGFVLVRDAEGAHFEGIVDERLVQGILPRTLWTVGNHNADGHPIVGGVIDWHVPPRFG